MPTLGAGFKTTEVAFIDPQTGEAGKTKLNLWDTAGQEKFDALTKIYFKQAEAAIIVYDVTSEASFEKAQKWVRDLIESEESNSLPILKFLVGNKSDLTDEKIVQVKQGTEYAKSIDATFSEVSAKEDIGIKELFEDIALKLYSRSQHEQRPRGHSVL